MSFRIVINGIGGFQRVAVDAHAFLQPETVKAQNMAETQGGRGMEAVFVGIPPGALLPVRCARAGRLCPRFAAAGDFRLFFPRFLRPARHFV
jgi:hypothetical protein